MSVTAVPGFVAGGVAAGIKASGNLDLALVATADRTVVPAAGVFTTNLAVAAPVQVSKAHLADGRATAVVLSSGNANAATGAAGRAVVERMCALVGAGLGVAPTDVLACQTGLIGIPLPVAPFETGVPAVVADLGSDAAAGQRAADAILTTDTRRKETLQTFAVGGSTATVGGFAKGAAMLSPAMATMLAALATDVVATPPILQEALGRAVEVSFNTLIVDACRSTNDTVLVLANGRAGNPVVDQPSGPAFHALVEALSAACDDLAHQMAADAEGATKLATLTVRGARTHADARIAARGIASSQLVQCSLYGCDPYWGRILSELGASGAWIDPDLVDIAYNGITVARGGLACEHDAGAVAVAMAGRDITIDCFLHLGHGHATVRFTDLTHAYVDENMGTS